MDTRRHYTRRDALGLLASTGACLGAGRLGALTGEGAAPSAQSLDALVATAVERNDTAVQSLLRTQVTDWRSQWRGSVPDQFGLHCRCPQSRRRCETLAASFVHPRSRYHRDGVRARTHPPRRGIPRARAGPAGQHRPAHHELQLASGHGLRRAQRRDRSGDRPPARCPGDCGHAAALPVEGGGGDGRREASTRRTIAGSSAPRSRR